MAQKMSGGDRLVAVIEAWGAQLRTQPVPSRIVAAVMDYFFCGILSFLPASTAVSVLTGKSLTSVTDLVAQGLGLNVAVCVVLSALLVSYIYYVVVPLRVMVGQTPGKRLLHLEVVMLDGSPATLKALSIRWAFLTFVETIFTLPSAFFIQLLQVVAGDTASTAFTMVGGVASAVSIVRAWIDREHRCLHDILAGTWVYLDRG